MILDTCFLIDLQRELRDGRDRGAASFLRTHPTAFPKITWITWMEFAEGYDATRESECRRFLSKFPLLEPNLEMAWRAAQIQRALRQQGLPIGDHDAWIAAAALVLHMPLVTTNQRHFERIAGLTLLDYSRGTGAAGSR